MDRVSLHGLQCYGFHGVFPEERTLGQRFIIDLDLDLDLRRAGMSDDLSETVNYAEIAERTVRLTEGQPYKLIEALAEHIAAMVLQEYSLVQAINVKVTKPNPPVKLQFAGVSVTVHRTR